MRLDQGQLPGKEKLLEANKLNRTEASTGLEGVQPTRMESYPKYQGHSF